MFFLFLYRLGLWSGFRGILGFITEVLSRERAAIRYLLLKLKKGVLSRGPLWVCDLFSTFVDAFCERLDFRSDGSFIPLLG